MRPSQWAEKYRTLSRSQSDRFGNWRNANAPYLIGIMDLCAPGSGVEELTIMKAAQVGASEALRNVLAFWAHTDPDPVLFVMPDEKSGKKIVGKRLFPLFKTTPVLRQHLTPSSRDFKLSQIVLSNGFQMSLGWSGSPSTLASDPIRFVINDEVDKFQQWSGRESDPLSLARVRTQTYGSRRLIINISTPTTRQGMIARMFEDSDIQLHYFVPCPAAECGKFHRLTFDRIRWDESEDERKRDKKIRAKDLADHPERVWHECPHCNHKAFDKDKPRMVAAGVWAPADEEGNLIPHRDYGGRLWRSHPGSKRVGMAISALPCLWITFAAYIAEFIRSVGELDKMMNWRNSWDGSIFEQQVQRTEQSIFAIKSKRHPALKPGILPRWTAKLLAAADTQHDHFKFVIRAWAHGSRSHRVYHGRAESFDELRAVCLDSAFAFQPTDDGRELFPPMKPEFLIIDSGGTRSANDHPDALSRVEEVYRFALTDPLHIIPSKGESEPIRGMPIRLTRANYDVHRLFPGADHETLNAVAPQLHLRLIDTNYFKDLLASRIRNDAFETVNLDTGELQEVEAWSLSAINDPEYNREMASEHKILIKRTSGGSRREPVERWQPVTAGAANHFWDVEVLQCALAQMTRVDLLSPPDVIDEERRRIIAETQQARPKPRNASRFRPPDGRSYIARR